MNFTKEELLLIKDEVSANKDSSSIIKKIDETLEKIEGYDLNLYRFYWDCGRQGSIEGVFKAHPDVIKEQIGNDCEFGEVLGKHSDIRGTLDKEDLEVLSIDPIEVFNTLEWGYNPLDYMEEV